MSPGAMEHAAALSAASGGALAAVLEGYGTPASGAAATPPPLAQNMEEGSEGKVIGEAVPADSPATGGKSDQSDSPDAPYRNVRRKLEFPDGTCISLCPTN